MVTNDRWGSNTHCKHGGFFTCTDKFNPSMSELYGCCISSEGNFLVVLESDTGIVLRQVALGSLKYYKTDFIFILLYFPEAN